MEVKLKWKDQDKEYLKALEIFLDKVSNIQDNLLREEIIGAALKCDEILTNLAVKEISKNNSSKNCK